MEAHIATMTQSKLSPSALPSQSRTHRLPEQHRKPRDIKHSKPLDAAELCRRLDALRRQDRTGRYTLGGQPPRQKRPTVSSGPYHHVPCTAAKDFTRTTGSQVDRAKASALLSHSLPAIRSRPHTPKQGPHFRRTTSAKYGFARPGNTPVKRFSFPISQGRKAASPQCAELSDGNGSLMVLQKDIVVGLKGNTYDHLFKTPGSVRHASSEKASFGIEHMPTIEPQPDVHALAHKITRQHLEDKADWTQSDAFDGDGKRALTEWIGSTLLSVARKELMALSSGWKKHRLQ